MNIESTGILPIEVIAFMAICAMPITMIVHVAFAGAVFSDAKRQENGPELVGPLFWGLATLVGGVFVATAYWIMNRSTLRSSIQ